MIEEYPDLDEVIRSLGEPEIGCRIAQMQATIWPLMYRFFEGLHDKQGRPIEPNEVRATVYNIAKDLIAKHLEAGASLPDFAGLTGGSEPYTEATQPSS
jgi:hypothetical protein